MQFFRDGFHAGDPSISPAHPNARRSELPAEVDVLVVGAGPAGLVAGAQLAQFPDVTTAVVERRTEPLALGQADGVACRTVEMFQAFGFAHKILHEAAYVTETAFWRPNPENRDEITRTQRIDDVEEGISEMPHLIMNQARVHAYLAEAMRRAPSRLPVNYGYEFVGVERDDSAERPLTAALKTTDGEITTVAARYLVGGDGARSGVRTAIGRSLSGDRADHAWGVMDVLPVTDFPDIRLKNAIQSAGKGSIVTIPREGGNLVRLYVDLGTVTDENRDRIRAMTQEDVLDVARDVLHPFAIESAETVWFSVYEVAQRLADGFDDATGRDGVDGPRIFIAGDACHTHSAKAGQGMNVSMQDAFNIGWKLGAVVEGRSPASLLETYDAERRPIARELIDFDKEWSAMLAKPALDPAHPENGGISPEELSAYFQRQGRYTAGVAAQYTSEVSTLTGCSDHQHLAIGFDVGMRFHSAPVVRVGDAKPLQLGHCHIADGRWRAYAFSDASQERLRALCTWFEEDQTSPVVRFGASRDVDALIDVRGVLQDHLHDVEFSELPGILRPRTGRLGLVDYAKAFAPDHRGVDIFDLRGIDRTQGALVIVRPDQYIAQVLPLDAFDAIAEFFGSVFVSR
ncbi:FAD-dependent monooxygenase [Microbacterium sp. G2-8]|uniref:FAD-dependent monooxygenase n=1 Tax=Microbacterium sp. G2-8 TaxID=2842454 RepID=UPI001C8ADB6D|nr:FAD-dependent monooxygenase [Microbacterium sp. G2-8]